MLCFMIFSSTLLLTAVNVRAQCEKPIFGENRILEDKYNKPNFSDGETVRFKCSPGYRTASESGPRSITCMGTQWSDLKLQCQKKSCGNPGEISNGKYLAEDVLFGATITAVCNEGYQLVGQPRRNCLENGWDGRAPECEVVKCLPPPSITNGVFEPIEALYHYREIVQYSCTGGHDLIGPSVITCSGNGTFQPPPRCLFVSCDRPVIPNANRIAGKSPPYKYNNFIRYMCIKGYRMEGSDTLTCKEDGWDPPPPECTVITCLKPPAVNNGRFEPLAELYEYAQKVRYSCNEGFRLSGASILSCTDDGKFEPSSPECLEIQCDSPSIPHANIHERSPPYRYGDSVEIRCHEGYRIEVSGHLKCGEDGWIRPLPRCTEIQCDSPSIPHAYIHERSPPYRYGVSVEIRCHKGYRIEGSGHLKCGEDGWIRPLPWCTVVPCLPPSVINNGEFNPVKEKYIYQDTVTYSCKKGFNLQGASTVSCTEKGTFLDSPQCVVPDSHIWPRIWIPIFVVGLCCVVGGVSYFFIKKKKRKHERKIEETEDGML